MQLGHVPAKLNTVIQPLMGGLRREADAVVREAVASAVAQLVTLCADKSPSPNDRQVYGSPLCLCPGRSLLEREVLSPPASEGPGRVCLLLAPHLDQNPVACRVAKNICAMMCGDPAQQLAQQGAASAAESEQPAHEDIPVSQSAESIARQVTSPPAAVRQMQRRCACQTFPFLLPQILPIAAHREHCWAGRALPKNKSQTTPDQ